MDYIGRMTNVERDGEDISFTLDGKHFVSSGDDVMRTLCDLVDKEIMLSVPSSGDDHIDWLSNNGDHCFIESMCEIGPNHYEIDLGS